MRGEILQKVEWTMKKKIVILGLSVAFVFLFSTAAFAAGWKQVDVGWWYQN